MNIIEQVIRKYIPLVSSNSGWNRTLCRLCHDHGRKGNRGGFKFNDDHLVYHCFNCGTKIVHHFNSDQLSIKLTKMLLTFGVPKSEIGKLKLGNMNKTAIKDIADKELDVYPTAIDLPPHFYTLDPSNEDDNTLLACHFLENRMIDPSTYTFYLSNDKAWKQRLIIPYYRNKQLIFYQGRILYKKTKYKYLMPPINRSKIIYGYDVLFTDKHNPLFVVEGFFDAFHINGVATLTKDATREQVYWLNKSDRTKVVVPDKTGGGDKLVDVAIYNNWHISTPEIPGCNDVSDAICKYGSVYTITSIMDNMHPCDDPNLIRIKYKLYKNK